MTITAPPPTRDAHGNEISGSARAVAAYDHTLDRLLRYHPDLVPAAEDIAADPAALPMGQVFLAYLSLMTTDSPDVPVAREAASRLAALPRNERGQRTPRSCPPGSTVAGTTRPACSTICCSDGRRMSSRSLMGHLLDFFVGDAQNLRDRIGRHLPTLDPDHPHTGFVRGMHAFGLEESGHYERAERVGLGAVARNHDDVAGIHAVLHASRCRPRSTTGSASSSRGSRVGHRKLVHRPQLVAPPVVPSRSRPPRRGARDLRRARCTTTRSDRRPARDARRQCPVVARHARRHRHR